MADETTHPLDGLDGKTVVITPKDGTATYTATVRSVHETGFTLWMDAEKKDEGEVRTVHVIGKHADADYTVR